MANKTLTLAGTAILAALVVVFDYSFKYSGLKIVYPWLPYLKFDFTGVPILLSLHLFGFYSSAFTSAIAFLAIFARSGDFIGASMKALAEFSTATGAALALKLFPKCRRIAPLILGVLFRCVIMFFANLLVLPLFTPLSFLQVLAVSPLVAVFNAIQGSISIFGGFLIYEAVKKRIPSIFPKNLTTISEAFHKDYYFPQFSLLLFISRARG